MDVTRQGLPTLNHLLQHTLRRLCTESQWVYAVFWRILPRNYPPPQWDTEGGMMDRSKGNKRNWILVWEDGFCNFSACAAGAAKDTRGGPPFFQSAQQAPPPQRGSHSDEESEAMSPELFFKMSHEVYNYGEGLMGKVAADSSHKWVYREPVEHEISFLSPWQGSLDPHPRTWEAQFKSGIQTIAVVAVQEGVLQLGSTKKIMEDLNFVLHMQRKFNYLQSIPGVFVPHPMSCAGKKRSNNGDNNNSPPTERGHWMTGTPGDATSNPPHLTARSIDQFLSPRIGPQLWRSSSDTVTVLGVKRPALDSEPLSLSTFKDYNNSYNINMDAAGTGSSGMHHHRPECPSPPKSLNTGHTSPGGAASPTMPPNLLPSMSSLQALLSKLPSVTPTDGSVPNGTAGPNGVPNGGANGVPNGGANGVPNGGANGVPNGVSSTLDSSAIASTFVTSNNRPPVSRPKTTTTTVASDRASSPKDVDVATTKTETPEPLQGNLGATTTTTSSSGNSDVASAECHTSDDTDGHQTETSSQCKESQKFSSFLDTFDNLADFGTLHDSLGENADSYNSFLNEIYS